MKLPKAKVENIVVQNLPDETLIYDRSTDQAFCLNDTSAKVFEACDGGTTLAELKARHRLTDEIIYLSLDELEKNYLLDEKSGYVSPFAGLSRREVIKKVGLASLIALPVISSIIAPTVAMAASNNNANCVTLNQCRPGSTAVCPPGCTGTYDFLVYVTANGTCDSTATLFQAVNCSISQGNVSFTDYRRVS